MNKTVMITGATSGIGLGCARKFAENGDRLILTGRNEQRLEEIRSELADKGTQVLTLAFDVRDREAAARCVNSLPEEWREIDAVLVLPSASSVTVQMPVRSNTKFSTPVPVRFSTVAVPSGDTNVNLDALEASPFQSSPE